MPSPFALAERPVPEVLARIRRGLPPSMLGELAATLGLSTSMLAAKLGIARRTLARKNGSGTPLSSEASEKVLRLARIRNLARALFATDQAIAQWLFKPDAALGGVAPIDLLDTELGSREVETLVRSLSHGQFV
jgi:putative toxin-antitoxin system antitoxin component (TIGR02293 family)